MNKPWILAALWLLTLGAVAGISAEPKDASATPTDAELIANLIHDRYAVRKQASDQLLQRRMKAVPELLRTF